MSEREFLEIQPHVYRVTSLPRPYGGACIRARGTGWIATRTIAEWAEQGRTHEELAHACGPDVTVEHIAAALEFESRRALYSEHHGE